MLRNLLLSFILSIIGITEVRSQLIEVDYNEFISGCKFKSGFEEIVINSKDELWNFTHCMPLNFSFKKYTLIVVQYKYPCHCRQMEEFHIFKDERNKRYIIETYITKGGRCYCNKHKLYYIKAVYIPRVENDYEFIFTTGLIYNNNLCCPIPKPPPRPPSSLRHCRSIPSSYTDK